MAATTDPAMPPDPADAGGTAAAAATAGFRDRHRLVAVANAAGERIGPARERRSVAGPSPQG